MLTNVSQFNVIYLCSGCAVPVGAAAAASWRLSRHSQLFLAAADRASPDATAEPAASAAASAAAQPTAVAVSCTAACTQGRTAAGDLLNEFHSYPEWPHREGGCLTCYGCTFESS